MPDKRIQSARQRHMQHCSHQGMQVGISAPAAKSLCVCLSAIAWLWPLELSVVLMCLHESMLHSIGTGPAMHSFDGHLQTIMSLLSSTVCTDQVKCWSKDLCSRVIDRHRPSQSFTCDTLSQGPMTPFRSVSLFCHHSSLPFFYSWQ